VFFDECHKKTKIGRTGDTVVSFRWNEDALFDNEGKIADVDTKLQRLSFGVAAVELIDGTVEGRRCKTFHYSVEHLLTITAEEK
jgi:hypothetical protein